MAHHLKRNGCSIARRMITQIFSEHAAAGTGRNPLKINSTTIRVFHNHLPTYDKNIDDQLRPGTVALPEDMSDEYWVPHPTTGYFGPISASKASSNSSDGSILDREVIWFRSIDAVDKPTYSSS